MALTILQWNARGLRGHKDQLKNYVVKGYFPPDVICVEETFLKAQTQSPKLDGYNIIRKDCLSNERGGLAIYLKEGLNFSVLDVAEIPNIEIQGIEIKTLNGYLKIFNSYMTPSCKFKKEDIQKIFPQKRSLLVGDFNAHSKLWGCSNTDQRGKIIEEILTENNLIVLNTGQSTYITSNQSNSHSVIDLSISSQDIALNARHNVTNTNMGSDHYATITTINEEVIMEDDLSMHIWKLKKADWKTYKEISKLSLTKDVLVEKNTEDTFNNLVDCITSIANQSIPAKNLKHRRNKNKKFRPLPYWNDRCNEAIYKRNQSRNKMTKTRELTDFLEYKKQEAIVKQTLKTEAKTCWQTYCSELTNQTKLGSVWNWARRMNGIASYSSIPTLNNNGLIAETNLEKANLLAKTYENISNTQNYSAKFLDYIRDNNLQNNPHKISKDPVNEIENLNDKFDINELKQAIRSAKNNKSPGDDKIPYELLKHLHTDALKVLLTFYNEVWDEGQLPTDWHHAIILPLLKPNKEASNPESYRPISLTSTLCKVMEAMVNKRLQWYLEKNNIISKNQSGFRKYRNTNDQILKLQDTILKKFKNKEHVLAIFIDFERAYDMLHVPTLLHKFQELGIVGKTFNWVENFLSNRTFQVKVGAELSDKFVQQNGTPQGSLISPLLFLLMINNIAAELDDVDMSLFADDSAIYTGHRNIKILENKIQLSINLIQNWCNKNGFKISINKTTGVLFSKRNNLSRITIKIDQDQIKMDSKVKFLGVIFDSKLSWKPHIDYIIEKCKKRLNLMRAISGYGWGACKKTLLTIYRALIRSILDYGDVAYSAACKSYLNKLSCIQTEALRLCCGAPKGTAASALQNECGELPLHLRRLQNSIKFGTKILGSKFHPSANVMENHWTNIYRTSDSREHSIYTRTSEFFSSLNTSFIGPSFPSAPPWCNKHVEVDLTLKKLVNKKTDHPEFLKQSALELISKYDSYIHIYTDGSKADSLVSAAFTVPSLDVDKKFRLCNNSSIYTAELTAIVETILWILNCECYNNCEFAIFSDSLSVLTSIEQGYSQSRPALLNDLLSHMSKLNNNQVRFIWIPSHIDLTGNDRADTLAKEGLCIDHINSTNYLEFQEIFTLIKLYIVNKWQLEYNDDNRGHFYKSICPIVSTDIKYLEPYRHKEVQISRLRLGVANTNQRLFMLKRHSSGLCDTCQVKDTIDHLLLDCKKEDISNLLRNICQLYKDDISIKTILTIGLYQNEVYRLVGLITKGKIL
ncbi:MAG TPA: reverse transcriptase domain-containing protein [Nitrososphaeraceae archaeon]|nr:reverse transcriptase domain-containing protein [Nitrososphaeraceae archaeon]